MQHSSDLTQRPLKILVLYVGMIATTVAAFLWLSTLGASLVATGGPPHVLLERGAARQHTGDLFHVMLALLVVLVASRLLGSLFRYINQPPVIGEVVAGLMLGPSLLGRVAPVVSNYVLPAAVAPYLGVLAQIGVVLYMFLVGLELDAKVLRASAHTTVAISHTSIIVPFLLGAAASLWLYPAFAGPQASFAVFAMFMGLSLSVTAFPVLSRIVTDNGLETNRLGAIAISCAAIDDVTAWCLLAALEGMARARAGDALWTVGLTLTYVAVVLGVVRPIVRRVCARQDQLQRISPTALAVTLAGVLASSLLTEVIGIHALFGAFLLGAVVPHDSLLAGELARRMKDLVVVLLLPAFFAFTGMRTQIGLINGLGGWLVCGVIVLIACAGKVGGSTLAARVSGLGWRDAAALGMLMNTRGLMELIVLNIGLEMKLLSPALFAMMVLMAVATTFATSPAVRLLITRPAPA